MAGPSLSLLSETDESGPIDPYALGDEHEELYLSEREFLLKRRNELGDLFDKGRVTLASGALALTFGLLKDDLGRLTPGTIGTVAWGASVMAACLLLSVFCVYAASQSFDRRVDILDDDRRVGCGGSRLHGSRADKWAMALQWLNPMSLLALIVGLVVMGIGVFSALSEVSSTKETAMASKDTKSTPTHKGGSSDSTKSLGSKDRPVINNNNGSSGGTGKSGGDKK